jgi:NAD(P)-dependent dehydrogenase (short-subunit alcohol dehydrogenase family)
LLSVSRTALPPRTQLDVAAAEPGVLEPREIVTADQHVDVGGQPLEAMLTQRDRTSNGVVDAHVREQTPDCRRCVVNASPSHEILLGSGEQGVHAGIEGRIAVVAGATRGAGRGIATALGEAGATVYCTGRSVPGSPGMKNRPETIDETAGIVTARGGRGIAVRVDHTVPAEVAQLFERVGEFDILVNDIWGGDDLVEWGKKLWETKLEDGLTLIDRAIKTHIITSYYGLPRLRSGGLVVEITDGDAYFYRGHFFYDLVKTTVIRMAFALSQELRTRHPGRRRDAGLSALGVDARPLRRDRGELARRAEKVKEFIASETPLFVGRCVAALAADPNVASKNGRVFASWDLAEEYGVDDADGTRPHFVRWLQENMPEVAAGWKKADDGFYAYWGQMPYETPGSRRQGEYSHGKGPQPVPAATRDHPDEADQHDHDDERLAPTGLRLHRRVPLGPPRRIGPRISKSVGYGQG